MADRSLARRLAHESIEQGDALGWFESLYQHAAGDESTVPWADLVANPNLDSWLERSGTKGDGKQALVVGCGLGDDAERLASLGFQVTAFDISQTAIDWCVRRFPNSAVDYRVADLFSPPQDWISRFDFVFEAYTLQVLPAEMRADAARRIADLVAADGILLIVARGREPHEDPGQMPWPLLRDEFAVLGACDLTEVNFEDYVDDEDPPVRRFRAEYHRPQ